MRVRSGADFIFRITGACRWALILPLLLVGCSGGNTDQERSPSARGDYEAVRVALERLSARFPEATDTAVQDSVLVSVYCAVVHGQPVPADFDMFSPEGDREVRSIVLSFVERTRDATLGLNKEERIEALWGDSWKSDACLTPSDCDRA
jgi:hypothetical protein